MANPNDQEPASLVAAAAAAAADGDLKRGVSFPTDVDKQPKAKARDPAVQHSWSFRLARPPRPPQDLRRRHTHLGYHQQKELLKAHNGSVGPNLGFMHRLKTSFRLELEERRGPSLARYTIFVCVRMCVGVVHRLMQGST